MEINEKKKYVEITVEKASDLTALPPSLFTRFVFRGQGNKEWPLKTSLERMIDSYHNGNIGSYTPFEYEKNMLKEFKWKYPGYQTNPQMIPTEEQSIEWLSIMQHFGSKTRLLDFSSSLFIALYMAIYGYSKTDAAIWALNTDMIKRPFKKEISKDNGIICEDEINERIYKEAENCINDKTVVESNLKEKKLYVVYPKICNERISRQQGLFILPSNIAISFKATLSEYCKIDDPFNMGIDEFKKSEQIIDSYGSIKFIIPDKLRYESARLLQQMNISAETMYPGVEGLAKSMNCLRNISSNDNNFKTPNDIRRIIK